MLAIELIGLVEFHGIISVVVVPKIMYASARVAILISQPVILPKFGLTIQNTAFTIKAVALVAPASIYCLPITDCRCHIPSNTPPSEIPPETTILDLIVKAVDVATGDRVS